MRIQYSYRLVEKEFHEPWRMSVEKAVEPALKPLIEKRSEDSVRLQIVLERAKKGSRLTASGHMHLPGKKIVSVTASHNDLTPLAHMLAQALFRQAKKHFDRLSAQDQIKRKARRERLRELKARIDTQPASVVQQARGIIETLLPKVEAVAQRELAICMPPVICLAIIRRCTTWWTKRLLWLNRYGHPFQKKMPLTSIF